MTIKKVEIKVVGYLFLIGIAIFLVHFMLLRAFPETLNAPGILYAHPFLLILTIATIVALNIIFVKVKPNMLGYMFLASSMIKMALSVLYLIPVLRSGEPYMKVYVIQFFMIYFIYLAIEVIYLVRQFKNK